MTVNSSFSSNDSLPDCLFARPASLFFITHYITKILLLLPLCILVLYLGLQRWQRQCSSSTAAAMTHSDSFTYHMVTMELVGLLGSIFNLCGVFLYRSDMLLPGKYFWSFTWHGEAFFHILTCVEHYLAVVYPVTYLSLRGERGMRIRNISIGLSVLCVLIRPGPGEQGGDRKRVDQSKRRAFYTILAILGVLLLRSSANLAWAVAHMLRQSNMAVNSSSNNSLHSILSLDIYCYITRPSSLIFATYFFIHILLVLSLCIFVLYLGLQRWRRQRSTSTAAMTSHSDSFTYHMVAIELIGVSGCILCCCGIILDNAYILYVGFIPWAFTWYGETFFHILTCVERYLAVVHAVTYLSLKGERGIRIRNISTGCAWLLCFGATSLINENSSLVVDFCLLIFSLIIVSFCSLSVLYVLKRPGPGEQGGDRERVDESKRRAFYTIMAILGVLLLRCLSTLIRTVLHMFMENMTVNSSFSSNDSLPDCLFTRPASFFFITYYITNILLLLPLCILVLYLGLQRWQQQRSTSTAAAMTHSDSFTYHMVTMELVGLLGSIFGFCGVFLYRSDILLLGKYFWSFIWHGEAFFHILTCVEHYLAVIHPVTYLSLRGERGIRIRNISTGCAWLLCFGATSLINENSSLVVDFCFLIFSLIIVSFCSLSVLCVLIRPGPGEQGGDRERVDQSKRRAFYTILAILGVLLLRSSANLAWAVGHMLRQSNMAVNSSSNNSLHSILSLDIYCYITRPSSLIFATYFFIHILLVLSLCIFVLYLGLQRWRRQRSTSTAGMTSHSDSFTYHMVAIELIGVSGCILCCCGIILDNAYILYVGFIPWAFTWYGETFFHILTCVERYLAVVHAVTYLSLKGERGIRIRNISTGCAWLLCFGATSLINENSSLVVDFCLLIFSLIIVSFCSLSVLYVLKRPGPGEQGGDRERVDESKRRAFYTIMAILGVLLLRCLSTLIRTVLHMFMENMTVNSSFSSNDSLPDCLFTGPASFLFITYYITHILLLLPLCILVLYLGLQRWQRQRSTSTAAAMTHSDSFTYHMVTMELVGLLGSIFGLCGVFLYRSDMLLWGGYFWSFTWHGEAFFHILTCVEHYLAVVHPITYLSLRGERGMRIRNITIGCVWLFCVGSISFVILKYFLLLDFCFMILSLIIVSFCSLSVLCVLIRPGPGEQGGDRERVDQSKRRAFYTILAILGVLLLRSSTNLAWAVFHMLRQSSECATTAATVWLSLPSSLVLPLLFLHRAGTLACFKNNS
ncbi:hypothetical protein ABVT39_019136 [Epinephelus coioides]